MVKQRQLLLALSLSVVILTVDTAIELTRPGLLRHSFPLGFMWLGALVVTVIAALRTRPISYGYRELTLVSLCVGGILVVLAGPLFGLLGLCVSLVVSIFLII